MRVDLSLGFEVFCLFCFVVCLFVGDGLLFGLFPFKDLKMEDKNEEEREGREGKRRVRSEREEKEGREIREKEEEKLFSVFESFKQKAPFP